MHAAIFAVSLLLLVQQFENFYLPVSVNSNHLPHLKFAFVLSVVGIETYQTLFDTAKNNLPTTAASVFPRTDSAA